MRAGGVHGSETGEAEAPQALGDEARQGTARGWL